MWQADEPSPRLVRPKRCCLAERERTTSVVPPYPALAKYAGSQTLLPKAHEVAIIMHVLMRL